MERLFPPHAIYLTWGGGAERNFAPQNYSTPFDSAISVWASVLPMAEE